LMAECRDRIGIAGRQVREIEYRDEFDVGHSGQGVLLWSCSGPSKVCHSFRHTALSLVRVSDRPTGRLSS
jgi:hypothetical protein